MKVVILDNGLTGLGAHNFAVDQTIQQAFAARHITCDIYAARMATADALQPLNAIPHFSRYFYESVRVPGLAQLPRFFWHKLNRRAGQPVCDDALSERITHRRLNRAYRRDLARLPQIWRRGDLIVIPAICQNQLTALCDFLRTLPLQDMPTVICQLMFAPEWTPWGATAVHGEGFYREAFSRAQPLISHNLFFIAETEGMADDYRRLFSIPVTAIPLPLQLSDLAATKSAPQVPPLLAYLGYAKTERGFHLLPSAIALLAAKNISAQFLIQVQHSGWERDIIEAEQALRQFPHVQIVQGALSRGDYIGCLRRADAMLLPYDPARYGQRGSAVLLEAVAAGCPVVASDHSGAAQSIRAGEAAGTIMASFDAVSLAGAIENRLSNFPKTIKTARALAPAMVERHRPDRFVEALLNIVQQSDARSGIIRQ